LYPVVPFANFDELNARFSVTGAPRYQQLWFPGTHGAVGGGGNRIALSSIPLRWVALGAVRAGLGINPEEVDRLAWHMDPGGPLSNRMESLSMAETLLAALTADRRGPERIADLSVALLDRIERSPAYRPRTLQQVRTLVEAMSPEDWQGHRAARVALDGGPTHWPGAPYWVSDGNQTS
jgi:hypothetical protein